jgi:hypothetical protein
MEDWDLEDITSSSFTLAKYRGEEIIEVCMIRIPLEALSPNINSHSYNT